MFLILNNLFIRNCVFYNNPLFNFSLISLRAFADHVRRSQANHELADREYLQQEVNNRELIFVYVDYVIVIRYKIHIYSVTKSKNTLPP